MVCREGGRVVSVKVRYSQLAALRIRLRLSSAEACAAVSTSAGMFWAGCGGVVQVRWRDKATLTRGRNLEPDFASPAGSDPAAAPPSPACAARAHTPARQLGPLRSPPPPLPPFVLDPHPQGKDIQPAVQVSRPRCPTDRREFLGLSYSLGRAERVAHCNSFPRIEHVGPTAGVCAWVCGEGSAGPVRERAACAWGRGVGGGFAVRVVRGRTRSAGFVLVLVTATALCYHA